MFAMAEYRLHAAGNDQWLNAPVTLTESENNYREYFKRLLLRWIFLCDQLTEMHRHFMLHRFDFLDTDGRMDQLQNHLRTTNEKAQQVANESIHALWHPDTELAARMRGLTTQEDWDTALKCAIADEASYVDLIKIYVGQHIDAASTPTFVIKDNVLQSYRGNEAVVVVPDGVTCIGSKALYSNETVKDLYLPDTVEEIGFKALEHCTALQVLSFSNKMTRVDCNALNRCVSLRKIVYRGTLYEFSCLNLDGQTPDLAVVHCTDGTMRFGKEREYFIDTLYFPGSKEEWDAQHGPNDWRNRRCRHIVYGK